MPRGCWTRQTLSTMLASARLSATMHGCMLLATEAARYGPSIDTARAAATSWTQTFGTPMCHGGAC